MVNKGFSFDVLNSYMLHLFQFIVISKSPVSGYIISLETQGVN